MMGKGMVWACFLMLLTACGAKNRESEHHESSAEEAHHEEGHGESPGELHVAKEMLRDLRITTAPAVLRPAGDGIAVLGELTVNEDAYAEVGTPVEARITKLLAAPGDVVKEGAPLAELASADVGQARAALTVAEARAQVAARNLERKEALMADRVIADRERHEAQADATAATAELTAAQQGLAALGVGAGSGSSFVLRSPVAGTVLDRTAVRGHVTSPSDALFVVGDLTKLWLVAHVYERDAVRTRSGAEATINFAALPGRSFAGKVMRVGSRVEAQSRTVPVRIELPNDGGELKPGMAATAVITSGDAGGAVVSVPTVAVQRVQQNWAVFIPKGPPGVFEVRAVGRGRDLSGSVEILNGLRADERVVVDGAFLLKAEMDKARGGDEHGH